MKPAPSPPTIGVNLKLLRQKQRISLDQLARRAGVSKAMLSQIEQGRANPTVASVWKISHALGMPFQDLFEARDIRLIEVVRKNEAHVVAERKGTYTVSVVSPIHMVEDVEMYVVNIAPGGSLVSQPHYAGTTELVMAIKGTFKISTGDETSTIQAGDSARYVADKPHRIELKGKTPGMLVMVVKFQK